MAYNILSFLVHESWETMWARSGHNFYVLRSEERPSGWRSKEREMPSNYTEISESEALDRGDKEYFDCIVYHTAFGQRLMAAQFKKRFKIPAIEVYHCYPPMTWSGILISKSERESCADISVFATEENARRWGYNPNFRNVFIVGHTADDGIFKHRYTGEKARILTVGYDFKDRGFLLGYDLCQSIIKGLEFEHVHCGNGEEEIVANAHDLANEHYIDNRVFLNTAFGSPIPTAMLEALACGMPVVSVGGEINEDIFDNGVNGFVTNDPFEIKFYLSSLLKDKELAIKIGREGRKLFDSHFSPKIFTERWSNIFDYAMKEKV